jgi:hypothetical protein
MEADSGMLILIWIVSAIGSAVIGAAKGQPAVGALAGIFLGPFGLLAALLSEKKGKICPFCRETVHPNALVCRYCRNVFPVAAAVSQAEDDKRRAEIKQEELEQARLVQAKLETALASLRRQHEAERLTLNTEAGRRFCRGSVRGRGQGAEGCRRGQ